MPTPSDRCAGAVRGGRPARGDGRRALGRRPRRRAGAGRGRRAADSTGWSRTRAHGSGPSAADTPSAAAAAPPASASTPPRTCRVGEGGMVTTDDADPLRSGCAEPPARHVQGRLATVPAGRRAGGTTSPSAGLKANMTDIQAAIGRAQLAHLAAVADAAVREIAARYDEQAGRTARDPLPHRPDPEQRRPRLAPLRRSGCCPSAARPRRARRRAGRAGVGTSVHFIPVHQLGARSARAPTARRDRPARRGRLFAGRCCRCPLHPRLTDDQVDLVIDAVATLRPPEAVAASKEDTSCVS